MVAKEMVRKHRTRQYNLSSHVKYGELVFDVNSAYFYNHGGYEFAKQFYADAYKAAVEIVGGEQYILSACLLYTSRCV